MKGRLQQVKGRMAVACAALAVAAIGGAALDARPALAQGFGAQLPRAPVEPLGAVGVPDMNGVGLLDKTGTNAAAWPWQPITQSGKKDVLRALGKALFWDMQVGGDGIQSCASCHFHAGADNRIVNQINPGRDKAVQLSGGLNAKMTTAHFAGTANGVANRGFAVTEGLVGATADLPNGLPGTLGAPPVDGSDINDVMSSQGVRAGVFDALSGDRLDFHTLSADDNANGFTKSFPSGDNTVRRAPGRNSPSAINAVYNLRNFWDGRANMFFNGVNPFGVSDPNARVKTYNGALGSERLDLPFSSLASQAVGPIGSDFEMIFSGRSLQDLGKKLTSAGVVPLDGQTVAINDSLLASVRHDSGKGLTKAYAAWIREVFHPRFWGDGSGNDVCLNDAGGFVGTAAADACLTTYPADHSTPASYTLLQWNFPLFFGLAVQAYEATLTSTDTIVDLIAGGKATGTVTNGAIVVQVTGLSLEGCIVAARRNNSAAQQALATGLCTTHYAKFIHPRAVSGAESATALFPVPNGTQVGGQCGSGNTTAVNNGAGCVNARNTLLNVDRGLNRFFTGATACSVCHFNPEFTGATVATVTQFGAQLPVLPRGQLRRELEARAMMERMPTFNGQPAVYDVGFYNIGVRPTGEDISLGNKTGLGVPLSVSKLLQAANGGTEDLSGTGVAINVATTTDAAALLRAAMVPTAPNDLTPRPFPAVVACAPGLVGNGNGNNNPAPRCNPNVLPLERLLINGTFKTPGLRNVKFTGPYMHNGSKSTLRQVLEFYKTAGDFTTLSFNNLDAGMRIITLAPAEESSLIEMMETGLTDWRVAYKQAPFDHPELCVPNGHDPDTGDTILAGIPAVGSDGGTNPIATFDEMLRGATANRAHNMTDTCTVPDVDLAITAGT